MSRVLDLLDAAPADSPPRSGADRSQVVIGVVTAVSGGGTVVSVSVLGSQPVALPATASVWSGVRTAHVLMDAVTGRPVHVLGPATAPVLPVTQPVAEVTTGATVVRTVTLTPEWSGTWRAGQGWDQWNVGRYGGRTDLYQGVMGAASLMGMATYGARVTSLGATGVTSATVTVTGNGSNSAGWTAVIQTADRTDSGPTPSGATASVGVRGTGTSSVDVTALGPELLRGRGLALVGTDYGALLGTGQSMSLTLTYRAPS